MPFLPNIGATELLIIAFVLLLLFGGSKLNEWARGLGQAEKELKKVKKELTLSEEEIKKDDDSSKEKKE